MPSTNQPSKLLISVITPTYNAEKYLPRIIQSLRNQTNHDFEWIVTDGASTDNTLSLLSEVKDINLRVDSRSDFGIYDAMNRAIRMASTPYYLVLGADDILYSHTIQHVIDELLRHPDTDLLVGNVVCRGKLIKIQFGKKWLHGARAFVASHSVGCVFKKDIHSLLGYYSHNYSILADNYFIKNVFSNSAFKVIYDQNVFGEFDTNGISNNSGLLSQYQFGHIQIITEKYKFIQIILCFLRILKATYISR